MRVGPLAACLDRALVRQPLEFCPHVRLRVSYLLSSFWRVCFGAPLVLQLLQEVKNVPAKNPRVNVVLEKPLYGVLRRWAKQEGVSLSLKVRDLVKAAVEAKENQVLVRLAEARESSFEQAKALTHEQAWAHLKGQRR